MKVWKKNLVAGAVLLTVCGGIYANWAGSSPTAAPDFTETLNEEKLLSEDMVVMAGDPEESPVSTITDYFAAVRLSRQQARDSAVTALQEAMAYQDGEQASAAQLDTLVEDALCEAQIESLVIAKGYRDCVAYIAEDGISVAVAAPEGGIQKTDVAVVADIVMTQSDFGLEEIHVVEVQ